MKPIKKIRTVLFDGTDAHFTMTAEGFFTRARQDGSEEQLVYVSDNGSCIINSSVYLVFTYKGETYQDSKSVYTSFPQIPKLRKIVNKICELLDRDDTFISTDGNGLQVAPGFTEPFIISGVGQSSNWISFTLSVIATGDGTFRRGVHIQLPDCTFTSPLLADEFENVAAIINDINLINLKVQMAEMVLLNNNGGNSVPGNYNSRGYSNNPGYNNYNRGSNQQPTRSQYQQPVQPRFNDNPYPNSGRSVPSQPVNNSAPQQRNLGGSENRGFAPSTVPSRPAGQAQNAPARGSMTFDEIEKAEQDVPVFPNADFADDDVLSKVFGNDDE